MAENSAPKGLAEAFEQAGAAVAYAVDNLDDDAMRGAFGSDDPRVAAWLGTKAVITRLWTTAWAQWNAGQWVAAGDNMQLALREAGLLWREVNDAKRGAMRNAALRIFINNSPLRFGEQAVQGVRAAQNALDDNGIPKPGIPTWVKVVGALAIAGVVWMGWKK